MRAIAIHEAFGIDNLRLEDRALPEAGPGEVRIRLDSVSLNYRDLLMVQGHYNPRQPLPLIPCSDGVGRIDALGPGTEGLAVGDRVIGCFAQTWQDGPLTPSAQASTLGGPLDGMLTEYRCLPATGVIRVPEYLTNPEAATLPCAALTAWSALVTNGSLQAGERVLLLGTGGVSIFALQLAKSLGAEVVITSSDDGKLERARSLGADHCINYRQQPDWHKEVLKRTGGVDHVVEVGGAGTFDRSVKSLKPGGQMHLIGVLAGANPPVNLTRVLMNHLSVQGIFVGHRQSLAALLDHLKTHQIQPLVDRCFAFEESAKAFTTFAKATHFGKVCIDVSP
jgi:NADPH:quinone reductase-like Zn-dependent oxidoreductase